MGQGTYRRVEIADVIDGDGYWHESACGCRLLVVDSPLDDLLSSDVYRYRLGLHQLVCDFLFPLSSSLPTISLLSLVRI